MTSVAFKAAGEKHAAVRGEQRAASEPSLPSNAPSGALSEPLVAKKEKHREEQIGDFALLAERLKEGYVQSTLSISVPFAIWAAYSPQAPSWLVFWLNFIAIIPLSSYLGQATEDLSGYAGEVTAGLLNATFGNVVEMMVVVMALLHDELGVVQAALLGSMLSNLLFVLGSCFVYGGCKMHELRFCSKAASTCTSLMLLACMTLSLPTFLASMYPDQHPDGVPDAEFLKISRYSSIVIFLAYLQFLYFQLMSHKDYFEPSVAEDEDGEEEEEKSWSLFFCIAVLLIMSVLTAISADGLVGSIQDYSVNWDLNKDFISLILVASVGNIPEFYVTLMVAKSNKIDLALTIAVGSSCQMALFVTPFAVIAGWAMDKPMSLNFHGLQILCLVLTVLVVSSVIQGGTATWLQGSLLVSFYMIIAMTFFFLPSDINHGGSSTTATTT